MKTESAIQICTCGHSRESHSDESPSRIPSIFTPHNGPCLVKGCTCKKFVQFSISNFFLDAKMQKLYPALTAIISLVVFVVLLAAGQQYAAEILLFLLIFTSLLRPSTFSVVYTGLRTVWASRHVEMIRLRFAMPKLLVYSVLLFAGFLFYITTLAYTYDAQAIFNIVGVTVTIEGFLLGLLSLSVFAQRRDHPIRTDYIAVGTILAILVSLATIMLAELTPQLRTWVLVSFFVDLGIFSVIVAVYAWILIEFRRIKGQNPETT